MSNYKFTLEPVTLDLSVKQEDGVEVEIVKIDLVQAKRSIETSLQKIGSPEPGIEEYLPLFMDWFKTKYNIELEFGHAFQVVEAVCIAFDDLKKSITNNQRSLTGSGSEQPPSS
jgi:hypothetical protein